MALSTIDDATRRAPKRRRPKHCCLDKGYDYATVDTGLRRRRIIGHTRRRGEQPLVGPVRGKPRRWVVERTNGWHNRFRGLLIRWERNAANYLALVHFACAFICFNQANGHAFRF
jgi:Transposase DDE domain